MSIGNSVKGAILSRVVSRLADDHDLKATILGAVLAGVVAVKIDYAKLLGGDPNEIGNLVAAVVVALIGYYTNKPKGDGKTKVAAA